MNFNAFVLFATFAMVHTASAFDSAQNQTLLNKLQANRIRTIWNCKKGEQNEALVMFTAKPSQLGLRSGTRILAVQDEQICKTLQVTCPFVATAIENTFGHIGPVKYGYWATGGKYQDTVMFFSDGQGMKVVSISNGSQSYPDWASHWYFNPGECILH